MGRAHSGSGRAVPGGPFGHHYRYPTPSTVTRVRVWIQRLYGVVYGIKAQSAFSRRLWKFPGSSRRTEAFLPHFDPLDGSVSFEINMRGYSYSPSPPRSYRRRARSPSPRGYYGGRGSPCGQKTFDVHLDSLVVLKIYISQEIITRDKMPYMG
ncbi:hypothetical protein EJB05_11090, partial [Eragrostis curvula]